MPPNVSAFISSLSVKNHTIINLTEPTYYLNNHPIPGTRYNDFFKYLGIQFNPSGKMKVNINKVSDYLHYLQSSPLKPQHKLFMLREYLIPKLYHQLILGRITISLLKQLDPKIRQSIKSFLHLQHFTPDSFFYTSVADSGLGIPQQLFRISGFLLFHLEKLHHSNDTINTSLSATDEIQSLPSKCLSILNLEAIPTKAELWKKTDKHTRQQLYSTVNGLQETKKFPPSKPVDSWCHLTDAWQLFYSFHPTRDQSTTKKGTSYPWRPPWRESLQRLQ